ncbi:MAG: response regulator [Desulfomonile tiedjei]|nr:response regulator [Desulfomonile tiedjei]
MRDNDKSKEELLNELKELRKRVTDRTRSERRYKHADGTARELLETSVDMFVAMPCGLFVYQYQPPNELFLLNGNPEAKRLTGIGVEEWRGEEFDEMWPNARSHGLTAAFLKTMETGQRFETDDGIFRTGAMERVFRIQAFRMPVDRLGVTFEPVPAARSAKILGFRAGRQGGSLQEDRGREYQDTVDELQDELARRKSAEELLIQADRSATLGDCAMTLAPKLARLLRTIAEEGETALSAVRSNQPQEAQRLLQQLTDKAREADQVLAPIPKLAASLAADHAFSGTVFDLTRAAMQGLELADFWWDTRPWKDRVTVALEVDLTPGCHVEGEEGEIVELVFHLVKNAIEAISRRGTVKVKTAVVSEQVVLEVTDDGMAIPKEHVRVMFSPLWTTKGAGRRGMGLARVSTVVRHHGGGISVESKAGKGTSVTVKFPLAEDILEVDTTEVFVDAVAPLRILIVDDKISTARLLERGLSKFGHRVHSGSSSEQAMEILQREELDLVICNLTMPESEGWELATRLQERSREKSIARTPFLLLVEEGRKNKTSEELAEYGVDRVVPKPINIAELIAIVRGFVRTVPTGMP